MSNTDIKCENNYKFTEIPNSVKEALNEYISTLSEEKAEQVKFSIDYDNFMKK